MKRIYECGVDNFGEEFVLYSESIDTIAIEILLMRYRISFCVALKVKDYSALIVNFDKLVDILTQTLDKNIKTRIDMQIISSQAWLRMVYRDLAPNVLCTDSTLENILLISAVL